MFLIIDFAYKNMQKKKSFGQLITKIRQNVAINFIYVSTNMRILTFLKKYLNIYRGFKYKFEWLGLT